jgi:hypothetical protein
MSSPSRGVDHQDQMVDWILGEISAEDAQTLEDDSAADTQIQDDADELRGLFDDLRLLSVEPSSRVAIVVRSTVDRRARIRAERPAWRPVEGFVYGLKVAAVAAVVICAALLTERFAWRRHVAQGHAAETAGAPVEFRATTEARVAEHSMIALPELPLQPMHLPPVIRDKIEYPYRLYRMDSDASHTPPYAHVAETRAQDVWLSATNAVASMRLEFTQRFSPRSRRLAIRASGGSRFLAARIETLADELAAKIGFAIEDSTASVQDVALSLRAMMAGGSTRRIGDHSMRVRQCTDWLVARLPELHGGELATALSGLVDVAVVSGPKMGRLVGEHASRLAESIIFSYNDHRPSMLNWQTDPAQLADAGQVLRLAPAFGTVNKEALVARAYLATHISERIDQSTTERPELLAANLYGFGDLIDRGETERRLGLWHARDLVPEHYVALHHVAWSRFPLRSGWADFQLELRSVSTLPTPAGSADTAALLLALAVNYAAPGSSELFDVAMR